MKSDIPRSVRLEETTETRLKGLLKNLETLGIGFPEVVNMAIQHLLHDLEAGAKLDLVHESGPRLVWPDDEKAFKALAELDPEFVRLLRDELARRRKTKK